MLRWFSCLVIAAVGMVMLAAGAGAQMPPPKGNEPQPVSISFRNDTKMTLVVQGASKVNGIQRRGQPVVIKDGKTGFDNNVPPGPRKVTIVDFNTNRTLLLNYPFVVPQGRDLQLVIRSSPSNPNVIVLAPDQ